MYSITLSTDSTLLPTLGGVCCPSQCGSSTWDVARGSAAWDAAHVAQECEVQDLTN